MNITIHRFWQLPSTGFRTYLSCALLCLLLHACAPESPIDQSETPRIEQEQPTPTEEQPSTPSTPSTPETPDTPDIPPSTTAEEEPKDAPHVYTPAELEQMTYELEVVFHILASPSSKLNEKVTPERIEEILKGVNALYAGASGGADMRVRFVPATHDPQGAPLAEKGIVRTTIQPEALSYTTVRLSQKGGFYHRQSWDVRRFINVFLFRFTESKTAGVSTYPDMPAHHPLPGLQIYHPDNLDAHNPCVTLNESQLGNWKKGSEEAPNNGAVIYVAAHELGHYLGLYHPFQGGGDRHDFCDDTKEYDRTDYENRLPTLKQEVYTAIYMQNVPEQEAMKRLYMRTPLENSAASFVSTNIMDYYETYGNHFTPDQVARVRQCLYHSPTLPGPKLPETEQEIQTRSLLPAPAYKPRCIACGGVHH